MGFPTLQTILGQTQLIQPVPKDLTWKDYFCDPWYLTERLSSYPREEYSDNKLSSSLSRIWDTSIGLTTDLPKVAAYTAAITYLLHQALN